MKKLPIVLIILGILIMLYPIAGGLYTQYQDNKMINEWLQSSTMDPFLRASAAESDPEEAYAQLQESFEDENDEGTIEEQEAQQEPGAQPQTEEQPSVQAEDPQEPQGNEINAPTNSNQPLPKSSPKSTPKPSVKQEVMGVIIIDKIKVKCPIVEGVKKENLKVGIGHIPGTALLGQPGNCALAGHRSHAFGRFFNRLDELKEGDEITIMTKQGDYKYVVYEKLVVTPDDVSVIKRTKDDSILTMVTCTPLYVATHRLIVHARLISAPVSETAASAPASVEPSGTETPAPSPNSTVPATTESALSGSVIPQFGATQPPEAASPSMETPVASEPSISDISDDQTPEPISQ